MRKFLAITLILLVSTSCEKRREENLNCKFNYISKAFLKEYYVVVDSCKTFNGKRKKEYYHNDNLLMSGYDDRMFKEGKWTFFSDSLEIIAEGELVESQPVGSWKLKNKYIDWDLLENQNKKYKLSIPKGWHIWDRDAEENVLTISNTDNLNKYDLKINITSGNTKDLSISFEKFVEETRELYLKNNQVSGFKFKKLQLPDVQSAYEFNYSFVHETGSYSHKEYFYNFHDMIYIFSISRKNTSSDWINVVEEVAFSSFKIFLL